MNKQTQNPNHQTTIQIPNYQITETIYSGSRTLVYRGIRTADQLPVIIKLLKNLYPTFSELVQFRNQYAIAKNLPIDGIISPLKLERFGNSYGLVMADWGGISLETYIQQQPLDLTEKLAIARQITDILHELHQHQVIHKDIKPANILIHPQSKQVKLIDFSIASVLPKETQEIQNPNVLEGTLAYLAPEQTGRMNRGIDYRSDFYAFGVTLYQLFTGRLPFVTDDPMELVHCHIAKMATPIHQVNTDVPKMLEAIVAKMMAKNAEDRYQSALGLKYDLSECLNQWKQTESITEFELGQRDLCDRFLIPEKLYGRGSEVQTLLDAFDRVADGASELMLVAGFSGIGKTAVVNEVHKPIVKQRGYFIKGKFDQFNRNIPFSAFVQALRDLMGQLLSESDEQLQSWRTQILSALGENAQVIVELIPELERIIGNQPPAPKLSGTAAQNRFNLLFQRFIQVFTSAGHPLVIFVDDLQWADSASLNLMKVLMNESDSGYLLILGAYRDNEVFPAHPLMLTVDELEKQKVSIHTLTLEPLSQTDINQLVADTLQCASAEVAQPLSELTYQNTKGNPFFTTQFLQGLYGDGYITFNLDDQYWQCNLTQVWQLALTDDVVVFIAGQLQKLPTPTQDILKIAACIGNQFDLATLSVVCKQPQDTIAIDLWPSLQAGLVIPESETYKFFQKEDIATKLECSPTVSYRFLHDRVQQAAYRLIPDPEKQKTHYQIGKLLQQATTPADLAKNIFDVVNHLNYGIDLITDATERQQLVELNWLACQKAKGNTAYRAAHQYVTTALQLLGPTGWQDRYNLSLSLNNTLAELNLLIGDFVAMDEAIDTILGQSQSLLDRITAYRIRIQKYFFQNQLETAVSIGIEVLQKLGVDISFQPTEAEINKFIQRGRESTQGISIPDLLDLPEMKDPERLAIAEIATQILAPSNMVNPPLFPILVSLLVDLSVRYGNIASSALIYGCYGVLACNFFKEIEIGVAFGRLATDLDRHPITNTLKGRGMMMCGAFLEHRQAHLNKTLDILSVGYQMSLEVGDVEFVGHNVQMYCFNAFWSGYPLHSLQKETDAYISVLSNANQALQESYTRLVGQVCSNLLGRVEQPWVLIGTNLDESEWIKHLITNREISGLSNFYLYKIFLCFLFEEPLLALDHVANIQEYSSGLGGFVLEAEYYFYSSLVRLATISHNSQEESLDRVTENQLQLRDYWAKYAPMNHQNKVDLVEAEKARVLGNRVEAIELYDCAIAGAKANKYLQEEALANELAAKFYLDWGKEKVASGYMQEAYYCYARWGAKTKTDDLEKRYPQLLQPILQQQLFNFNPKETLALYATSLSTRTNSTSSTNISDVLDFTSVLKAAQAISSSLELDTLIASLTRIILENSGAKKAVLILPQEQTWQVKAMTWMNYQEIQTILEPQSLDHSPDIPIQIIHYVKNTQQTVVIDNCQTDTPGLIGEYMLSHQPQSVLCTPIINQGNLVGIIYLENKLTSGVFTRDRLRVLNFLCAQAAISLENARLYQQSQKYAQQLEQSLSQLQVALRERQQAQTALAKEREFLNAIIHNITDGIVVCDASGKLTLFNKATREFHGLPIESLPPEQWAEYFDLYQPDGHTPLSTTEIPLFRALQGEIVENAEMVIAPKQGSQRILLASGQAIFDPSGNKVGAVVVMRDITDRKKAELALEQKSQALEQALNDLQQAQLQIVQSEKMSALGNLVAGVAHEMNNPLGFISATLQQAQPTVAEILEHLKLYQETFPNSSEQILEHREEIDLDYSLEDLPKMMDAMIIAGDRLKSISTSLRTFSRADKDYKVPFNIHEGIDSTLLILKHRLKANEKRPEIEVIANYGNLPEVQCFPGQLNQVFMNILANAIDALDESNIGLSFAEIQANPNRITIQTSLENEAVKITIGDNGMGMNEEVKQKIFDHLFTTKGVGKGTGLGLAIARQIVVEKHGGEIHVNSILGEGTEFIITLPNEA